MVLRVRALIAGVAVASLGAGLVLLSSQAYLRAKAVIAGDLIERACTAHLQDGRPHRPWSWADMYPVARLEVPRLDLRRIVLTGATGCTLAFDLGHVSGTALPGEAGNVAIAGHRDTRAGFLKDLRIGDEVLLQTRSGTSRYRVSQIEVVRANETRLLEPAGVPRLTLITCYPFSGILQSPWRIAVICSPFDRKLVAQSCERLKG